MTDIGEEELLHGGGFLVHMFTVNEKKYVVFHRSLN